MIRHILLAAAVLLLAGGASTQEPFALTLLHTNDTHAAHLPDADGNGGAARLAAAVNTIRAEGRRTLLLDAGDRFQGSLFHTRYRGQDQVAVMNLTGYDAMALGNHEFDSGDAALAAFIDGVDFPVLAANIDVGSSPELAGRVAPSAVLIAGSERIGVIGLTTAQTVYSSSPGDAVVFSDDYAGIVNAQAAALAAQGVNKVIVLAHLGIFDAARVIPHLTGVDVFIDGHSHTLFGNSAAGAAGRYPQTFADAAGQPVYYVQAGANTQYLGRLDLTFDAEGQIIAAGGDAIHLGAEIPPDAEMEVLIAALYEEIEPLTMQSIGAEATALLTGDRRVCRAEECALGSLIADAMRAGTGRQIAITNGGGIRADIDAGEITLGDVLNAQPFGNLISTFDLTGAGVIAALENGVGGLRVVNRLVNRDGAPGRFPQVSGLRFTFDPNLAPGRRIVSVEVEAADGMFVPLDPDATYGVVTNGFMRAGGDGYTVFAEQAVEPYDFGAVDYELTAAYFAALGAVSPPPAGRITMVNATLSR